MSANFSISDPPVWPMSVARNGDIRIHYEVEGTGPALLLHTGAGGDLEIWKEAGYPQALHGLQVILMDPRGRGQSSRPTRVEDHRMERYAEDIVAVLDDVGADTAGFWGYSNGFHVGLAFGSAFPRRLRALVGTGAVTRMDLTDLPPIPDRPTFIASVIQEGGVRASLDRYMLEEEDRFPDAIDRNVRATDAEMGALRQIAWRSWRGPKSVLASIQAPVLIIQGEKEDKTDSTQAFVAGLRQGRVVTLPGQGHLSSFYRSDLAIPIALPFLQEYLGAGR